MIFGRWTWIRDARLHSRRKPFQGGPSRREANDIDIIVPATAMAEAESALQSCGYRAATGYSRDWRQTFQTYQNQYMFVSDESEIAIDLHWGFTQKSFPFPELIVWNTIEHVASRTNGANVWKQNARSCSIRRPWR